MGDEADFLIECEMGEHPDFDPTTGEYIGDDDDESKEFYKALKDESRQRRRTNEGQNTELLRKHEVHFITKNGGNHLIVKGPNGLIDFWPSTHRWIERGSNPAKYTSGVYNLIRYVKGLPPSTRL